MRPLIGALAAALFLGLSAFGQEKTASKVQPSPSDASIQFASSTRIPSLFTLDGTEVPLRCGTDGAIFLRLPDNNTVMRVDKNAEPTKYSTSSINDALNPYMLYFYPAEDALYALIRALPHTGRSHRVRPNGSSREEYQVEAAKPEYYIARFDLSGTYRGAQKLDVPFMPVQIGAFSSGDFLVSGLDQDNGEPRLALVNRRGQFIRTVELEGDITGKSAAVKEQGKKWFAGASLRSSMLLVISTSDMVADGGNLLLVRKQSEITVFEISPAGEVRRVKIRNTIKGARLDSIKSADGRWLVQLTKDRSDGMGFTIYSYTVDPQDGRVLERLVYDDAGTLGLACYNAGEFTALQEQEGAVLLLRGTLDAKKNVGPGEAE